MNYYDSSIIPMNIDDHYNHEYDSDANFEYNIL